MRQIICEKNQAPLAPPAALNAREALEVSWSTAERGEGPGNFARSDFQAKSTLFSILPTSALSPPFSIHKQHINL